MQNALSPASFTVPCPGCGRKLRFAVAAETPHRLRIECDACRKLFSVRRPGSPETAAGAASPPPTVPGFPVSPSPRPQAPGVLNATLPEPISAGERPAFQPEDLVAGRYRILRFIARGGMGEVYEVEDLELHERVALKTVRSEVARDASAVERFKREIQLARKVTHPNVCRIFDVAHHRKPGGEGVIFLTMELLPGETLAQRLQRAGAMEPPEALPIVRQIAEALHAAHQAGVVHRDLKPGNVILVEGRGGTRAVVTDFGLARPQAGTDPRAHTLTAGAAVVGTPAYLAPEQVEGGEATPSVDVYALGIVLFEMLTCTVPFLGDTAMSTAVKRLWETPPSPRIHAPGLDPRWEGVVLRCLERKPADRFSAALEVVAALTAPADPVETAPTAAPAAAPRPAAPPPAPAPAPEPGRPARRPPAPRQRSQILGLISLIVLAAAIGWYRYTGWKTEQTAAARSLRIPFQEITPRRSVAVLGFKDLSGGEGTGWLSPAIAEMLSTELAAGGRLRVVAGENVVRAKADLGLGETDTLARQTLARLRSVLGTDAVILGSYVALEGPEGRRIRLDVRLLETSTADSRATIAETGSEAELFDLVTRVGRRLRRELGVEDLSAGDPVTARAALPGTPEAARLYAEGLQRLRGFDPVGARDLLARAAAAEPGNALVHAALATAWSALGYDGEARQEAKRAFDLASNLPREERLLIEGRYREVVQDWERAVESYWTLWTLYPDNLDHGLRLAATQTAAGQAEDALAVTDALRTLPPPARDDPRIDLIEATAAGSRADFTRQREAAARAAAKGKELGAPLVLAQARILECRALRNLGQADAALAACDEGRRLHEESGDRAGAAEALTHAANVRYDRGELAAAAALYQRSLATFREVGNRAGEAGALNNIAVVLKSQGDLGRAQELYQEVLAITREIDSLGGEAYALNNLAGVLLRRGSLEEAAGLFEQTLAIRRELGDRGGEAFALDNLGVALRRKGDLPGARQRHEEALALRRQIGHKIGELSSLQNLGSVLLDQGELQAARRNFRDSLALCRETGSRSAYAQALYGLGEVFSREGNLEEARRRHEAALALRMDLGEKGAEAESRLALASIRLEAAEAEEAAGLAAAAAAELRSQGRADGEALALSVEAAAAKALGDTDRARERIARATFLLPAGGDLRTRLAVTLQAARLAGGPQAERAVRGVLDEATRTGLLDLQLEARLTLAEIEGATGRGEESRSHLETLEREARSLSYGLIARKASSR
jgi:eukaryotic-like serine/threonine-protein kinase